MNARVWTFIDIKDECYGGTLDNKKGMSGFDPLTRTNECQGVNFYW